MGERSQLLFRARENIFEEYEQRVEEYYGMIEEGVCLAQVLTDDLII